MKAGVAIVLSIIVISYCGAQEPSTRVSTNTTPKAMLTKTAPFYFNSFVDCNMAEAWVGDTFRIFPGKYGEDPLWGNAHDLKFADGRNADEAFRRKAEEFKEPMLPPNAPVGAPGLHGAIWFETVYQNAKDKSGKTLYAIYHNENYPITLPYDSITGSGYKNVKWPQGLTGAATPAAVCRIGVMKSVNGGHSWENRGLFIEDLQHRMILRPHNTSVNFAGGTGDPSAVRSGDWLYLFYGEYGYPGVYDSATYDPAFEHKGQCISVARIRVADLDDPQGKAKRWDGKSFNAPYNGVGAPIHLLQISPAEGGGPTSSPTAKYYWGPSVSWNTFLHCWVMLMARAEGPSWQGNSIYISFNKNPDLGKGYASQQWTTPQLLIKKEGHELWYPSLQPLNTLEAVASKNTCLNLGQEARLFFKDNHDGKGEYVSEYLVRFQN
jgi:hypothetical protein